MEGFAGPARGAGIPNCTRTSQELAKLLSLFEDKQPKTGEGADDLHELTTLVGKLACFKRDLMNPGRIVQATRGQPFNTSTDMEPIAETTARIFAKTIPKRDLDISFDKWNKRGTLLIRRLCTSYSLSPSERTEAVDLFDAALRDIAAVAYDLCQKGDPTIAGAAVPRVLQGYEPPGLSAHMEYKGYY
jgi:hypothetical protein